MPKKQEKDMSCLDMTCLKKNNISPLGLALSGGGALGAYQIGAWKALSDLKLDTQVKLIAGTSIGAINGALIIQGEVDTIETLWRQMKPETIFQSFQSKSTVSNMGFKEYLRLTKEFFTQGKIDISPFKALLSELIDEDKIRNAPIDFALNVWNVFKMKGEQYFLRDIPNGELVNYLIASASFPLFWPHRINNNYYLDGGIDLNLPIDILFDQSDVSHVIGIDVATFMKYRPKQLWKSYLFKDQLTLIRPTKSIGNPAHFSSVLANRQISLGYKDAMNKLSEKKPNIQSQTS